MLNRETEESEGEGEREKLSGADPLIPLQASRNKLVQTQTLFSPPPPLHRSSTHFLSFLGSLKAQHTVVRAPLFYEPHFG